MASTLSPPELCHQARMQILSFGSPPHLEEGSLGQAAAPQEDKVEGSVKRKRKHQGFRTNSEYPQM